MLRLLDSADLAKPDEMANPDDDEVVVRIAATPQRPAEGRQLADEILSAVAALRRNGSNRGPRGADRATLAAQQEEGGGPAG